MLVALLSPHPGAPARPSTPKVLRAKEHALNPSSSIVFTLNSHWVYKGGWERVKNAEKREVLEAHVAQVLQSELESLRAQLANLKGKSSQPASHAQLVQGSGSQEGPLRLFYGLSHDATTVEYVFPVHIILVSHQNLLLFFALPTSWHKKLVWHPKFLPLGR
jgi:hypothetical protein